MASVIVKHHPSGGPADPTALVDGPTYDNDPHIVTGLENVDNTRDVDKPVSIATQAAITSAANVIDVCWVAPSQSNGNNSSESLATSPVVPASVGLKYQDGVLSACTDPVGNSTVTHGSVWPSFALNYWKETGRRVCVIPCAVGSSAMQATANLGTGYWAVGGTLYPAALATYRAGIAALVAAGYTIGKQFAIPFIGETDATGIDNATAGVTANGYKAAFIALAAQIRADTGIPNFPIYFSLLGTPQTGSTAGYVAIRAKQIEIFNSDPYTDGAFWDANRFAARGLMQSGADALHYLQIADNEVGRILASNIASGNFAPGPILLGNGPYGNDSFGVPVSMLLDAGIGVTTALANQVNVAGGFPTFSGSFGTPTSLILTNANGLPVATGLTGAGTGVLAALQNQTNTAGGFPTFSGSIGAALATALTVTTINKVTITQPASGSTLTIANGKTATFNNSIAFSGTDSTTMTFPSTSATVARTDAAQTFTGTQTFSSTIAGNISGNAATVTTNANLTGYVTSVGNATSPAANSAVLQAAPPDPTGTTSGSGVMMGLGATCHLTPTYSSRVEVRFTGYSSQTAAGFVQAAVRYGTGAAPGNGVAATGTTAGTPTFNNIGAAFTALSFSNGAIITGLTPGVAYWFDLVISVNTGTGSVANIGCSIKEVL